MEVILREEEGSEPGRFKVVIKIDGPTGFAGEWGTIGVWEREYSSAHWDFLDAARDLMAYINR